MVSTVIINQLRLINYFMDKSKIIVILSGALALAVAGLIYLSLANRQELSQNLNQISQQPSNEAPKLNLENQPSYKVQSFMVSNAYDTSIIDTSNGNQVVVASTTKLCGDAMDKYVFLPGSTTLYMAPFNPGADIPMTAIYSLDLKTQQCNKMAISQQLEDFGQKVLSPNQTRLAVALEGNARQLVLLDLATDTSKILVTLPTGQTLNGGDGGLSNFFAIRWINDTTISYTVFADSIGDNGRKTVIDERTVQVK